MKDRRSLPPGSVPDNAAGEAKTDAIVAVASTVSFVPDAATEGDPKCHNHGWNPSSEEDGNYQGTSSNSKRLITPWLSCSSQPPPPPDNACSTSDADCSLGFAQRSTGPALRPDQRNRRLTEKLQILSWNPCPARGSDPSTQATHLNGAWHVVRTRHPASLRCSPQQGHLCARRCVHADPGPLLALVLFVGRQRRGCHINNECAKRGSVCIAPLLLIRDLCMKLGAVILTGDTNKGA